VSAYPVAASAAVAGLLCGPPRRLAVVAATAAAVYLADPADPAATVCLAAAHAVRVPCALMLGPGAPPVPAVCPGEPATAGRGGLVLAGFAGRVTRWWRPPCPGVPAPGTVAALRRALPVALGPADPYLAAALAAGTGPDELVARLLGYGPGLTPLGDDVLAGLLVTARATGAHDLAAALATAIGRAGPGRTTAVSRALLHHAARGRCVPELAAVLAGRPGAVPALLAVGHSSGAGLATGVLAALGGPAPDPDPLPPAGGLALAGGVVR